MNTIITKLKTSAILWNVIGAFALAIEFTFFIVEFMLFGIDDHHAMFNRRSI